MLDANWQEGPPGNLDDPDLYDGILWRRSIGYLVDAFILSIVMVCTGIALGLLNILSFGLLLPVKIIVLALLPVAYHTYFIGNGGATPGMRFMDVEVRTWLGRRPDYVQAFLMTVMFYASVLMTGWLILLFALFNDRNRTAHDFLSGTLGVRHSRLAAATPQTA